MDLIKKTYNKLRQKDQTQTRCLKCDKTEFELSEALHPKFIQGLCFDCEVLTFPERFHGCGFCKRPIREKFSCTICSLGFVEWVKDTIHPLDNTSRLIRGSAKDLLEKTIDDLPIEQHEFIKRVNDSLYHWPGFYAGITNTFSSSNSNDGDTEQKYFPVWIIPKLTERYDIDYSQFKFDLKNFQRVLLDILKTNNINLYDDIQIDLTELQPEQIAKVNPYDTRIVRI